MASVVVEICGGEYLLNTPENAISETLNFKMSLDVTALKNLRALVRVPKLPTIHSYLPAT